jgi:very-short-patch-repair endonuclease
MTARPSLEVVMRGTAIAQHGAVTRDQLIAAGFTPRMITRRIEQGRLVLLHRGVYRIGLYDGPHTGVMAAVLACGSGAFASHRTAAALWELLPGDAWLLVDVTVPGRDAGRRPGIHCRRVAGMLPEELTRQHGVPVTTPTRTLLDLAGVGLRPRVLEQAVAKAERLGLTTAAALLAALEWHGPRPGVRLLRSIATRSDGRMFVRSEAEEQLLALVRRGGLPAPEVNGRVAGHEVDFAWVVQRLIVEVDGYAFHGARSSFESDRRRDLELAAAGFRVIRVSWRQITREPHAVLGRIALAVGQGSSR